MGSKLSVDESVRVVIVGGGFGGIEAALQLQYWEVPFVLVDMRDAFHHNVAYPRASVQSGKVWFGFIKNICNRLSPTWRCPDVLGRLPRINWVSNAFRRQEVMKIRLRSLLS